ncbi:MAG: hypothetical protein JNM53_16250 [Gemmatimonadetes bacterium]|nr:hypothetical protein [Gemmatimonadota bacterium]
MRTVSRLKHDAGRRMLDLLAKHPDPTPAGQAATQTLTTLVEEGKALFDQQESGFLAVELAVDSKLDLRRAIRSDLKDVVAIGDVASIRQPEAAIRLRLPATNASQAAFLSGARVILATAAANRELLETYGLASGTLEAIASALDRFEGLVTGQTSGQRAQVGASNRLKDLDRELMVVIRQLDTMQRRRFRDDAKLLGAWRNARNIHWRRAEIEGEEVRPNGAQPAA